MRINHYRNHYELTRKDLMVKNLKRFKRQFEREQNKAEAAKWDFYPTTFVLPVSRSLVSLFVLPNGIRNAKSTTPITHELQHEFRAGVSTLLLKALHNAKN